MAVIKPFRAIHYNTEKSGAIDDLVAPPYDVINPEQQDALYEQHPNNIVRLILGKEYPEDSSENNKYTRAGEYFKQWLAQGILTTDEADAMYIYSQTFEAEGGPVERTGFFSAVKLENFGEKKIYPHEKTMSGPKADRMQLIMNVRANLSPIFAIYPDRQGEIAEFVKSLRVGKPFLKATEPNGVENRLWRCTDRNTIETLQKMLKDTPLFIADGHHRYETALAYHELQVEKEGVDDPNAEHAYVLMTCVSMADTGLVVLPTHRLIKGLADFDADAFLKKLAASFAVDPQPTGDINALRNAIAEKGAAHTFGLYFGNGNPAYVLTLTDAALAQNTSPDQSPEWNALDVSVLHLLILEKTLGIPMNSPASLRHVEYQHNLDKIREKLASPAYTMAFLLNGTPIEAVERIASNHERMPPKSTFFYPKLLSGLVMHKV